ncbi:Phospholipase-like protein [Corchorus olitorius]|uniref:Phospholipase-like protein n=1 Tax=Corchorus olitorius TaxID=93759 RepID=A0A1R3KGE7_9ROSI|nr:Phospholipase-like protein [Corchorus olitorius]
MGIKKSPHSGDNHEEELSPERKRELIEYHGNTLCEDVKYLKFKDSQLQDGSPSRILQDIYSDSLSKHSKDPIWRGCFNICNSSINIVVGLVAYLSSKACSRMSNMARSLPASLSGETIQQLHVWPKQFDELQPTNDDIGFYFLPESERFEKAYASLLDDLVSKDYALEFVIGNVELLVFSSLELQLESQRTQGKSYIWGLFRRKKVNSSLVDGCFPHEQGNLRGIQHSDSAAAVDAGKERNYTEGFYLPHPTSPSKDSASAGSGTSWQDREVINQCSSMTKMEKRMEEQSRNGRQVSGVFREVNNGATIKEIKATRKGVLEIESHGIEGRASDAAFVPQGPIEAIDQEVSMVPSSTMHEQTMIDITQQHVAYDYEQQKYPIEADRLGNENMHMVDSFLDELVNISKAHQAVALQSTPTSLSISAAPDVQAPNVNMREENKKVDASHELVNSDKINHSDDSTEQVGPYFLHSYAATILRSIFNQYGDIAQDCPLSIRTRSRLLEGLCFELEKVLSIGLENLHHRHLESLDSLIGDAESE